MVTMCAERVRLARSSRDASVVVLPEPVGPVTSTRPRGRYAKRPMAAGTPSSSSDLISCGMVRKARPYEPRCAYTLTRNRETPFTLYAKSSSRSRWNCAHWVSFVAARTSSSVSSRVSGS